MLHGCALAGPIDETEISPLYHTGECPPDTAACVLPINVNISLQYKGAGALTDAIVSFDVYPKNVTADGVTTTERAIQHRDFSGGATTQFRFTRIRVMFPKGFDVCDSVIGVQGNMSGVTIRKYGSNVTRPIRFYKAGSTTSSTRGISEPSISIQLESRPIPRTGTVNNLLDPPFACPNVDVCKSRFLELISYGPKNPEGGDALIGDQSSDQVGDIERIQFVISNVRNTLFPGPLQSPMNAGQDKVFGVQIYKTEVTNGIPEIVLTHYNNRVNDPELNHTMQPWFTGTTNDPIEMTTNKIWDATAQFADARTNVVTDLIFTVKTFAAIPPGGAIRFQLPPHFKELTRVNTGILTTTRGGLTEDWGETKVYATIDNTGAFPGNLTLQRDWTGGSCSYSSNPPSKEGCEIPPMSVITVRFRNVLSPSASTSDGGNRVVGGVEVGPFKVETLHVLPTGENVTIDYGMVPSVVIGAAPFPEGEATITLSSYVAGQTEVDVIFDFKLSNSLGAQDKLLLRIPRDTVMLMNAPETVGCKISAVPDSNNKPLCNSITNDCSISARSLTSDYLEMRMDLSILGSSDRVRICIPNFKNREYSGPAVSSFMLQSDREDGVPLDSSLLPLSGVLKVSALTVLAASFPIYSGVTGDVVVSVSSSNPIPQNARFSLLIPSTYEMQGSSYARLAHTSANSDAAAEEVLDVLSSQAGHFTFQRQGSGMQIVAGDEFKVIVGLFRAPPYAPTVYVELNSSLLVPGNAGYADIDVTGPQWSSSTFDENRSATSSAVVATDFHPLLTFVLAAESNVVGQVGAFDLSFTTVNAVPADGNVADDLPSFVIKFPSDLVNPEKSFDLSQISIPDPLVNREAISIPQCTGFMVDDVNFRCNATAIDTNLTVHNNIRPGVNETYRWYGNFTTEPAEIWYYSESLHGDLTGGFKFQIDGSQMSLTLTQRLVSEVRNPAVYALKKCNASRYEDCAVPCSTPLQDCNATVVDGLNENCTCLAAPSNISSQIFQQPGFMGSDCAVCLSILEDSGKCSGCLPAFITTKAECQQCNQVHNITDSCTRCVPGAVSKAAKIQIRMTGVRNPLYAGEHLSKFVVATRHYIEGVDIDGTRYTVPPLVPGLVNALSMVLSVPRAGTSGSLSAQFNVLNAIRPSAFILLAIPMDFKLALSSSLSVVSKGIQLSLDSNYPVEEGVPSATQKTVVLRPEGQFNSTHANNETSISISLTQNTFPDNAITTRGGSEGVSDAFTVTIVERVQNNSGFFERRVVDVSNDVTVPLKLSEYISANATVTGVDGNKPRTDKLVKIDVRITTRQRIEFPKGKIIITFPDAIILPQAWDTLEIFFPCAPSRADCDEDNKNKFFRDAIGVVQGNTVEISRRQWSLLLDPEGGEVPAGQSLQLTIEQARAAPSVKALDGITVATQWSTSDGLKIIDFSRVPSDKMLVACDLQDARSHC